jgi:hypothetical protein
LIYGAGIFMSVHLHNRISHTVIIRELADLGFARTLICWAASFLREHFVTVVIDGVQTTTFRCLTEGAPQGSALSVILFLLTINRLLRRLLDASFFNPSFSGRADIHAIQFSVVLTVRILVFVAHFQALTLLSGHPNSHRPLVHTHMQLRRFMLIPLSRLLCAQDL